MPIFNLPKFLPNITVTNILFYTSCIKLLLTCTSKTETSSDSNSGSSSTNPIIAGAVGGVVTVLFVIILLCVVFLYRKYRLHKKKAYSIPTMYSNADAHSGNNNYYST